MKCGFHDIENKNLERESSSFLGRRYIFGKKIN